MSRTQRGGSSTAGWHVTPDRPRWLAHSEQPAFRPSNRQIALGVAASRCGLQPGADCPAPCPPVRPQTMRWMPSPMPTSVVRDGWITPHDNPTPTSVVRERLMDLASEARRPVDLLFFSRSLPARSTRNSLPTCAGARAAMWVGEQGGTAILGELGGRAGWEGNAGGRFRRAMWECNVGEQCGRARWATRSETEPVEPAERQLIRRLAAAGSPASNQHDNSISASAKRPHLDALDLSVAVARHTAPLDHRQHDHLTGATWQTQRGSIASTHSYLQAGRDRAWACPTTLRSSRQLVAAQHGMPKHGPARPRRLPLTAWEREEWALRAVKAVVRLRSPRCSRCRHCVMLLTCG